LRGAAPVHLDGITAAQTGSLVPCRPTGGGRRVTSASTGLGGQERQPQAERASGILPEGPSGCPRTIRSVGKMPTARWQPLT